MTDKEKKILKFQEVYELANSNPSNKKISKDELIKEMRNGSLKFYIGNGKTIDDFYGWCKHNVDSEVNSSHPLNWITLSLFSSMTDKLPELPGISPIIESIKKQLVKKSFSFVILPALLLDSELLILEKTKENYLTFTGQLINDSKNKYFSLKTPNGKICLQYCWIIRKLDD